MSFDLASFARQVPNSSDDFDYYENNARRLNTAKSVGQEKQARPGAVNHAPGVDLIPLPAPGEVLLFSGAQLHTSIPNTSGLSRYSVDFRTVDVHDLRRAAARRWWMRTAPAPRFGTSSASRTRAASTRNWSRRCSARRRRTRCWCSTRSDPAARHP